jgi:signal transduction histidine kinase
VVVNLINNAVKFTPGGGTITLIAEERDDNLVVEITDTGSGISREDQVRLFEPYYRKIGDRERLSGLGLGLALAKGFVELHGGRIWVKSDTGQGSTFGFSIPIAHEENSGGEGSAEGTT